MADADDTGGGLLGGFVMQFDGGGVDDAAGADDEVRRPQDAPVVQQVGGGRPVELVVGWTGDGGAAQPRDAGGGEDGAERGRYEHVHIGVEGVVGGQPGRGERVGQCALADVDIACDEVGSGGGEVPGDVGADPAETEDGEATARQLR